MNVLFLSNYHLDNLSNVTEVGPMTSIRSVVERSLPYNDAMDIMRETFMLLTVHEMLPMFANVVQLQGVEVSLPSDSNAELNRTSYATESQLSTFSDRYKTGVSYSAFIDKDGNCVICETDESLGVSFPEKAVVKAFADSLTVQELSGLRPWKFLLNKVPSYKLI